MKVEKNILIAFILNVSFSLFELLGGILTNSISIISDAIHDMGDAISIGISYILEKISKKDPDDIYTYGYTRYSVMGAVITTVILLVGSIFIIINAINRMINPVIINYDGMIIIALFGVIINFLAAYFTSNGKSLNQRAVNLHMLEDVLGWIIVLVGSIIIKVTSISIIDSIMSILVALFILISSLKNLKEILDLFLEKIPNNISIDEIKEHLLKLDNIKDVHHIHIWSIDGINNYATMHVVVLKNDSKVKNKIREELIEHGISHVTIEIENVDEECTDIKCHVDDKNVLLHHHNH